MSGSKQSKRKPRKLGLNKETLEDLATDRKGADQVQGGGKGRAAPPTVPVPYPLLVVKRV